MLEVILIKAQKIKRRAGEHLREYGNKHEQNVSRSMDIKGHSGKVSDGNEGQVFGKLRKGSPYLNNGKKLAELFSSVL